MGPIYHPGFPWDDQYRRSVKFTCSITHFTGCTIGLVLQSNFRDICNWSNKWWWRQDEHRIFRLIVSCGRIWCHSSRAKLMSCLQKPKEMTIECLHFLFCVILSVKARRYQLAYESYACDFSL